MIADSARGGGTVRQPGVAPCPYKGHLRRIGLPFFEHDPTERYYALPLSDWETRMSRAINVNATKSDVEALCLKHKAPISAIETLASGGTRVVFMNGDAAAATSRVFGKKVLSGNVERTPLRLRMV